MRNKKPADVAGVVSFYGPIDIMETLRLQPGGPVSDGIKKVFEIEALDAAGMVKMKEGSPDTYIHRGSAPFLFIHGTKDEAVPYNQSPKGVELFNKAGVPVDLITVQDGIHGVINWEKDPRFQGYKAEMIAWLKRRLRS
jgi:dipeptidyl aminopeptidase/acylaminoacyl peptidase